jgi:tetratricopeptide (TPR) repeat protein
MRHATRILAAGLLLAVALPAAAAAETSAAADPVAAALEQAKARHVPVLIDYSAPWCYSCYYMAKNVLNGPEWERAKKETVVVELDADSQIGSRYMAAWSVKAMPTYLVFNADGQELGRVLGEQTRADFYAWLFPTIGRDSLESLKARVTDSSQPSVAAAREVLRAYHARYDAKGGLDWFQSQPAAVRGALSRDAQASSWVSRLELMRATADKDLAGCVNVAPMTLDGPLGCERPYELSRVMACTEAMPQGERRALLRSQAEPMQVLFDKRVLSSNRCADERSVVLGAADLQEALGNAESEKRILDRAIADVRARIDGDYRKDRNLADNYRVYLDRAGRVEELDEVLPKLIEAYPDDYVYSYRHAKSLAARGKHAEALPFYEKAAEKTYGVNKLRIAELRAKSLQALGKNDEARAVLAAALQDNGPWFPEDAAKLKAMLQTLPPASDHTS